MKSLSKFRIYLKGRRNALNFLPRRMKRFHRTKWKFVIKISHKKSRVSALRRRAKRKKKYDISIKRRVRFVKMSYSNLLNGKKYFKMKKYFKNSIQNKNIFLQNFDNSFNFPVLRKDLLKLKPLNNKKILNLLLVKQIYSINVLLWRLQLFSSSSEASFCINNDYVRVNGKKVRPDYFLKNGDVVEFKNLTLVLRFKQNLRKYLKRRKIHSFIEIDYYTFTLIIIKDYNDFIFDDLSLAFPRKVDVGSVYSTLK